MRGFTSIGLRRSPPPTQRAGAGGRLLRETARHLAVRMSYEDVIRVAQAKIDPARRARIVADMGVKSGEPFTVTEFLKPGIEELCSVLPPWLAQKILSFAERRGWLGARLIGACTSTARRSSDSCASGCSQSCAGGGRAAIASAKSSAPSSAGSDLIGRAARSSTELALEVAECARLIKGYGDTHKRGTDNYHLIERCVIDPRSSGGFRSREQSMPSPAHARRRWSTPKAKAWPNVSATSNRNRRSASPRSKRPHDSSCRTSSSKA